MNKPTTQLNMVGGFPLQHTQSPTLHNYIYQRLNLNTRLIVWPHNSASALIQTIKRLEIGLTAVTMPFKETILRYLDYVNPDAEKLGAVNTIVYRNRQLQGYNTDIDGIAYALRHLNVAKKRVLIIGAGGAARAVGYFMQQQRAQLFWLNRTQGKLPPLIAKFGGELISAEELHHLTPDIIINATPLGMYPSLKCSPLTNYRFKSHQLIFDLVYNPYQTQLLKQAKASGAVIISGLDMFIGQGLRQVELWIGETIEIEKLSAVIRLKLITTQRSKNSPL